MNICGAKKEKCRCYETSFQGSSGSSVLGEGRVGWRKGQEAAGESEGVLI